MSGEFQKIGKYWLKTDSVVSVKNFGAVLLVDGSDVQFHPDDVPEIVEKFGLLPLNENGYAWVSPNHINVIEEVGEDGQYLVHIAGAQLWVEGEFARNILLKTIHSVTLMEGM